MDKLNNSEDAKQFLRGKGLRVDEDVISEVIDVLNGKTGKSLYSLYKIRPDKPLPICGKGTVSKIKKLYNKGELDPYLAYLLQPPIGSGEHKGVKRPLAEAIEAQQEATRKVQIEPHPDPETSDEPVQNEPVAKAIPSEGTKTTSEPEMHGSEEAGIMQEKVKPHHESVLPDICSASPEGVDVILLKKWGIPGREAPDILFQWRSFHREGLHDRCVLYRDLEKDLTIRKFSFERAEAALKCELEGKEFGVQFVHRDVELGRIYRPGDGIQNFRAFLSEIHSLDKPMLEAREKHLKEIANLMMSWHNELLKLELTENFEGRFEVEDDPLFDNLTYHCSEAVYANWDLYHLCIEYRRKENELASIISKVAPPESNDKFPHSVIILALEKAMNRPVPDSQIESEAIDFHLWIRNKRLNMDIANGTEVNVERCQKSHANLVREYCRHKKLKELVDLRKKMLSSVKAIRMELQRALAKKNLFPKMVHQLLKPRLTTIQYLEATTKIF